MFRLRQVQKVCQTQCEWDSCQKLSSERSKNLNALTLVYFPLLKHFVIKLTDPVLINWSSLSIIIIHPSSTLMTRQKKNVSMNIFLTSCFFLTAEAMDCRELMEYLWNHSEMFCNQEAVEINFQYIGYDMQHHEGHQQQSKKTGHHNGIIMNRMGTVDGIIREVAKWPT